MSIDWYQLMGLDDPAPQPQPQPQQDYYSPPPPPAQNYDSGGGLDWDNLMGVANSAPQPSQPSAYDSMMGSGNNYAPYVGPYAADQMANYQNTPYAQTPYLPADQAAQADQNWYDTWFQDQAAQQAAPPPEQQAAPPPQPDYNPFDIMGGVIGGLGSAVGSYIGNTWNAVAAPWQAPDKQNMNAFEWMGGLISRAAGSALGGATAALAPSEGLGHAADAVADSGIPGVNAVGQAVRNFWEQGVEPAANLWTGTLGETAAGLGQVGGDVLGNVFGGQKNDIMGDIGNSIAKQPLAQFGYMLANPWAKQAADDRVMSQAYQYYQQLLSEGKPQAEALRLAGLYGTKLANPVTEAEQPAMEDFNNLPSWAQLPIMFSDKLNPGLKIYNDALAPVMLPAHLGAGLAKKGLGAGAGALADVTGTRPFFDKVGQAIEGPQKFDVGTQTERDKVINYVNGVALDFGGDTLSAERAVFLDTESPYYWESNDIRPDVANKAAEYLGVIDKHATEQALGKPDVAPQQETQPQNKVDLARRAQDTSPGAENTLFDESKPAAQNTFDATWQDRANRLGDDFQKEAQRVEDANPGKKVQFDDKQNPLLVDQSGAATPLNDPVLKRAFEDYRYADNAAKNEGKPIVQTFPQKVSDALNDFSHNREDELRSTQKMDPDPARTQARAEAEAFRPGIKTEDDLADFRAEHLPEVKAPFDTGFPQPKLSDIGGKTLRPPDVDITDIHRAVGIPGLDHTPRELMEAVRRHLGYDRKAFALEGTKGRPRLRETKPLEQFGPAGQALNKFAEFTMPYMGRAFLNKQGRAIRDTASNLLKYVAEGFGHADTDRFERVRQQAGVEKPAETLSMGRSSSLADIGGKESRGGFLKELLYHTMNPFDELSGDLMRAVSKKFGKGEIKDWNDFTEKAESKMKSLAYKSEFLRQWDRAIEDRVKKGALDPEIAKLLKDGDLDATTLESFLGDRMPKGASLDDIAKGIYNPQNYSEAIQLEYKKLFGDRAGPIGKLVKEGLDDLPNRVAEYNRKNREAFDAAVKKIPQNEDYQSRYDTEYATYQQGRPLTINDINPNHPIWDEMKRDIYKKLDVANKAAQIQESMDPEIRRAVRDQIVKSLEYAEKEARLVGVKKALAARIEAREKSDYFSKYDRKAPKPAEPAKPAEPPERKPTGYTQRPAYPNANVDSLKLQAAILKFGRDTKNGTAADTAIKQLRNPDPTKIIVQSDRADGPHFRVITPDKLGDNGQPERQVWPKPAAAAPAKAPSVYATSRERVLNEIKNTGYNEAHAKAGMAILDAYADAYQLRTGRSSTEVYDRISFKKGDAVAPGALEQSADIRRSIEADHVPEDTRWQIPSPNEIPGVRSTSQREGPSRIALRNDEDRRNGPAITPEMRARGDKAEMEQAQIDRFVEGAMHEIDYQLSLPDARSGRTWYTETWRRAMDNIKLAMPELQSDADGERLFKLFTGLTSQGTEVTQNLTKSILAFDRYAKSGRIRVTKNDAAPVDLDAMGLNRAGLSQISRFLSANHPDWTDFSNGAASLTRFKGDDLARAKNRLHNSAMKWLRDRSQALGITDPDTLTALKDLLTTREFRSDAARALDWASQSHTKAEIKRIYADMVNEYGTSEVFNRMLDVEYPGGDHAVQVPGARVIGPTPLLFGTETANFIKLADLVNNQFHGNIKEAMDWLQAKHQEDEFPPVLRAVLNSEAAVRTYMTRIRKAIQEDEDFHRRAGDEGPDYTPGEYGSTIFGPKIGNFVANLFGAPDRTTKDMWFTITWNRLMGNLGEANEPVLEAPTKTQGPMMDRAMADIVRRYRERHIDITQSQAQALLWFYEKQLAEIHGRGGTSDNFETAGGAALTAAEATGQNFVRGRPAPEVYRNISAMGEGPQTKPNRPLLPQAEAGKKILGTTEIAANGKYLISIFKDANASTMPHELAHVFRQMLPDELLRAAEEFTGATKGNWTVPQEEKFARGFENYLRAGKAPTPALEAVFAQFRDWLKKIYDIIKGSDIDVKLTPEIKAVFSKMLGGDPEKLVDRKTTRLASPVEKILANGVKPYEFSPELQKAMADYNKAKDKFEAYKAKGGNEWSQWGQKLNETAQDYGGDMQDLFDKEITAAGIPNRLGGWQHNSPEYQDAYYRMQKETGDTTPKRDTEHAQYMKEHPLGSIPFDKYPKEPVKELTEAEKIKKKFQDYLSYPEGTTRVQIREMKNQRGKAKPEEEDFDGKPADFDDMYDPEGNVIGKYSEQPDVTPPQVDENGKVIKPTTPEEKTAAAGPLGTPVEPVSQFDKTFNAGTSSTSDKGQGPAKAANFSATVATTTVPKASPVSIDTPWAKHIGGRLEFPKPEYRTGKGGRNEQVFPITTKGKPTEYEIFTMWQGNDSADHASQRTARWLVRNKGTGEVYQGSYLRSQILDHVKQVMREKPEGSNSFTRLAQTADEHTPEELAGYARAINAPAGIRLATTDGRQGQVVSPQTLRKYMQDWNRGQNAGDLISDQLTTGQKQQYMRDIEATDEYIRSQTGNTFKLDLDNFTPVRISDGKSLDELMGKPRQANIGADRPQWPAGDPPNTVEKVIKEVEDYFGKDARKGFAQLKKEKGEAAVSQAYAEIAKRLDFPDPTNVQVPTNKMGGETHEARKALAVLEADARDRYTAAAKQQAANDAVDDAREQTKSSLETRLYHNMAGMVKDADSAAYKRVESTYFDYRNKNVIDQITGSLLPFNYWARRNFAYVARYFANNPVQFAAILQFYKNMEQENQKAGGVASYNMANLLLWTNPDGSKVQWNMSSMFPFNPLGNSDSLMQLIDANDSENGDTVNKTPLAFLFGADREYKGKVTGRDKGIVSTFLSPNPVIDILLKTGVPNDLAKKLGIVTDGFGSPDPSDKRGLTQTTGLVAGRTSIRDIADRTGLTKIIREQATKLGIKFTDLDLEAPLNELIFGINAGKPITAVEQELTEMAQGDGKNKEQYMLALAKLKQGNWTPEALKALDTVESQSAWQRAASMAGFVSVVNNTPRQQLSNNLGAGYGQVAGDNGHYETTSVDPKTGYETKKFVPGESSKFFDQNPGASVSFAKNKTADQINESVGNDRTSKAYADLNKAYYDDKKISLKDYNKGLDDLKKGNPTFFSVAKDKNYQQAKGELPYLPGETHKSVADVDQQYAKQEIPAERSYAEYKDELYRAEGSGRYQEIAQKISDLYDKGDKAGAAALSKTPEYVALKAARDRVNAAYPTEAARKKAEDEAKYGPSPTSSTTGSSGSTTGTTTSDWTASQKSLYGKLLGQGYSKAAATSVVNKAGPNASSGSSKSSSSKSYTTTYKPASSKSSGSSGTTWTSAQSKLYGQLIGKGYSKAAAASVVNKQGSTLTSAKPTTAPFSATVATSKVPATNSASSASAWDTVQKKAYALALADGYSKTYAAAVADKIGSGQSTGYKSKLTGAVASYGAGGKPATGATTASKPSTTGLPATAPTGTTPASTSSLATFWTTNASGDKEASAQTMHDNGWSVGMGGYPSYAAAKKVAMQQMARSPEQVRAVVFDPEGGFTIYSKGYLNLTQADDALLRSETIANNNSAGYTNNIRSGGSRGGGGRSSGSVHIHPPVAPYRVPSPYSGTLNRLNKGRKF